MKEKAFPVDRIPELLEEIGYVDEVEVSVKYLVWVCNDKECKISWLYGVAETRSQAENMKDVAMNRYGEPVQITASLNIYGEVRE